MSGKRPGGGRPPWERGGPNPGDDPGRVPPRRPSRQPPPQPAPRPQDLRRQPPGQGGFRPPPPQQGRPAPQAGRPAVPPPPQPRETFAERTQRIVKNRRSGPPPPPPGGEPELLTHRDYADEHWTPEGQTGGDDGGGPPPPPPRPAGRWRSRRWRRIRKYSIVAALMMFLTPVLAFLIGWMVYDVPSAEELADVQKQTTIIYASDGTTEIGRYVPEQGNRIAVDISQIPEHVQKAVLSAEDRSFESNPGFDIMGMGRAAWNQVNGGTGGGSTITQQYVKVATGEDEHSIFRKYKEVIVAAKLTKQNSKSEILEDYLNTIYFGRGAYGIQAAAQAYFGKDIAQLRVEEGAVLAGLIQAPSRWDPAKNPDAAKARWDFVLDGMVKEDWLAATERSALVYPPTVPPGQGALGTPTDDRAHVVDRVLDDLESHGISREEVARNGGKIVTTIDPKAQDMARDAVRTELDGQPENLRSALVAVDPKTGAVRAYYGGSEGTGYDLAGGPAWNPGSSFKPFAMLAALEEGIGINAVYNGDSPMTVGGVKYSNSESASYPALTLREAMTRSVNTTFVELTHDVGANKVRAAALQAGIPDRIGGEKSLVDAETGFTGDGIALGQYPVHVIDMASAYGTFANDGMRHDPYFVQEYTDSEGSKEYSHRSEPKQAFDARDKERNTELARNVTETLTSVASSSGIPLSGGRQVAAKTGTHQLGDTGNNAAAWTIGYTPSISTAVWVGDPANKAIKTSGGGNIFGRGVPGEIWQRFMNNYLKGTPPEKFPDSEPLGSNRGPAVGQLAPPTRTVPTEPSAPPPTLPSDSQDDSDDPGGTTTDDIRCDVFGDCDDDEPEPDPVTSVPVEPEPEPFPQPEPAIPP